MKHTLSVLVENKPGVLARVASLFRRRGFNIDSLAVGPTEDPATSRMTIVVDVAEHPLEQVEKQLHKLVNVLKISDLDPKESVERELVLIKVDATAKERPEIIEIVDIFRAKIVDVSQKTVTVEVTGTGDKIKAMEDLLRPYGIRELVRTGKVALGRGSVTEA
ncbi:MAG: acetolactate synthase small subunit [Actinomycetota bacterium]|nr:acetolactate synthase small subunit [Actinomycetota bacterium]